MHPLSLVGSSYRFTRDKVLSAVGGEEVSEHLLHSGCEPPLQLLLQDAVTGLVLTAGRTCKIHSAWLTREQPKKLLCKDREGELRFCTTS